MKRFAFLSLVAVFLLSANTADAKKFKFPVLHKHIVYGQNISFSYQSLTYSLDVGGTTSETDMSTMNLNIEPRIGYFVAKNFLLAGGPILSYTSTTVGDADPTTSTFYGIFVDPEYYFPIQGNMGAYVGGHIALKWGGDDNGNDTSNDDPSYSRYDFGAGAGLAFLFGNKLRGSMIDLGLRVLYHMWGSEVDGNDAGDTSGIGIYFTVGVQAYL